MTEELAIDQVRPLPDLDETNDYFWQGGADGELRVLRCQDCRYWVHPWQPRCPECLSTALEPEATSGRGTVHTFTVNHQQWNPMVPVPYVIAVIELEDQGGLRVVTNLEECDPDAVHVGMPVEVFFREIEDVHLPLFRPVSG